MTTTPRKAESKGEDRVQVGSTVEYQIDHLVRKNFGAQRELMLGVTSELNAEGLSSLIGRVNGHSANEIDGLIAELLQVRDFLRTEGERVQQKINEYARMNQKALASIKVISDAIGPWKSATLDKQPPSESKMSAPNTV